MTVSRAGPAPQAVRRERAGRAAALATVRVESAPGDRLQIDFGQKRVRNCGRVGVCPARRGPVLLAPAVRQRLPGRAPARPPPAHTGRERPGSARLVNEATCSYTSPVTSTGIRELKDNLSRFIRRIEAGERIAITAHGRVVAELVPPGATTTGRAPSRFDELVAAGVIRPPVEAGDPTEGWPDIRLPAGTAAALIDADRGDA